MPSGEPEVSISGSVTSSGGPQEASRRVATATRTTIRISLICFSSSVLQVQLPEAGLPLVGRPVHDLAVLDHHGQAAHV